MARISPRLDPHGLNAQPGDLGADGGRAGAAQAALGVWEASNRAARTLAWRLCRGLGGYARAFRIGQPRAYLLNGTAARLDGRHGAARRAWAASLRVARALAMPHEERLARVRMEPG